MVLGHVLADLAVQELPEVLNFLVCLEPVPERVDELDVLVDGVFGGGGVQAIVLRGKEDSEK